MSNKQWVSGRSRFAMTVMACAALTACGGNDGSQTVASQAATSISGTAASGEAIAGAPIAVQCVGGQSDGLTGPTGDFDLTVPGDTPCVLSVTSGGNQIFSITASSGPVNVTPLTSLVVEYLRAYSLQGSGSSAGMLIQSEEFKMAVADDRVMANAVDAVRAQLLDSYGVDVGLDFLTEPLLTPESGNQNEADQTLDQLKAVGATDENGRPAEVDRQAISQKGSEARVAEASSEAPTEAPTESPSQVPTGVPTSAPSTSPISGLNLGGLAVLAPLQPLVSLTEATGLMPAPSAAPAPNQGATSTANQGASPAPGGESISASLLAIADILPGFDSVSGVEPTPDETEVTQAPIEEPAVVSSEAPSEYFSGTSAEAPADSPSSASPARSTDESAAFGAETTTEQPEQPYADSPANEPPVNPAEDTDRSMSPSPEQDANLQPASLAPAVSAGYAPTDCYNPVLNALGASRLLTYMAQKGVAVASVPFTVCRSPG